MDSKTRNTIIADRAATAAEATQRGGWLGGLLVYVVLGSLFGIVLVKAEVVSWFRIQEMFRFQSFHMYGVIGSAVATAALSVFLIRRSGAKTMDGGKIDIAPKAWGRGGTRYWLGGIFFGVGWALTGACPGPLFALLGAGVGAIILPIAAAVSGAWVYGALRPKLPH